MDQVEVDLGTRVRWVGEGPGRYLHFDCSNCNRDEGWALAAAFDQWIKGEPDNSVLVLADFENGYHETALTQRWKDLHNEHDKRVRKIACLGVVGTMKVVFASYRFFVRLRGVNIDEKMRLFDGEADALDWLLVPS